MGLFFMGMKSMIKPLQVSFKPHQLQHTSPILSDVFSESSKKHFVQQVKSMKGYNFSKFKTKDYAAVLVPLCTVKGEPSVLLTMRSEKMTRNKGDVSFPGGMKDESDENFIKTALREAEEEIGICSSKVEVWTEMPPHMTRGKINLTPVISYIGEIDPKTLSINADEVESVFSVTLESLCDPKHCFYTRFAGGYLLPVYIVGECRIWGSTAGILHVMLGMLLPKLYMNVMEFQWTK